MLNKSLIFLFAAASAFGQGITGGGSSASGSGVSYCAPAGASTTTYTCAPSPALTAYASGTTLGFVPDVTASAGAVTVNVNSLGAKSVKESDGTTNPTATDLIAGKSYSLLYDGAVFRITPLSGTVTSIATTSPVTGGTITGTGTIACATCVSSAAALATNAVVVGSAGTQASNTISPVTAYSALVAGTNGLLNVTGTPSSQTTGLLNIYTTPSSFNCAICITDSANASEAYISANHTSGTNRFKFTGDGSANIYYQSSLVQNWASGSGTVFMSLGTTGILTTRHILASGTAPTITSGFGTSPAITGADESATVTIGTGGIATTGTVTFGTAYTTNIPNCIANDNTTILATQSAPTLTTVVITAATPWTAGDKIAILCKGY